MNKIDIALQKIKDIIQGTMYEADYEKIREVLQSLQDTTECENCEKLIEQLEHTQLELENLKDIIGIE